MTFIPIMALGALVFTVVIFLKNATALQYRSVATQLVAWATGIAGVFLLAATEFARGITVGDMALDRLGFWSKVFVGLMTASLVSTLNEFKKAIDRTDTAVVPDWFEPEAQASARAHLMLPTQIATAEAVEQARQIVAASHTTPKGS